MFELVWSVLVAGLKLVGIASLVYLLYWRVYYYFLGVYFYTS